MSETQFDLVVSGSGPGGYVAAIRSAPLGFVLASVDKYRALKPDLVSMDVVMPIKSGIEATKAIIAEFPDAAVVMCSALGQESMVMEAIEAGALDFVVKPPRADEVLAVARKVLGENQPEN